jgi:Small integral membrane protein
MLRWTVIFLVVAIIAAIFGFGGIVRRSFYSEDLILHFYRTLFIVFDIWKISYKIGSVTRQAIVYHYFTFKNL